METITSSTTANSKKNVLHRVSDVPNGASLVLSTLIVGNQVPEASPVSVPASGVRTYCKAGKIETGSTTTAIKILTGDHHFKVGDFLCAKEGGLAYAITGIVSASGIDTITVGTAIDADVDGWVYEAGAESATTTSAFANSPDAIIKEAFVVPAVGSKVIEFINPLLHAVVVKDCIAPAYLAELRGVLVAKY